MLLTEMWLNMRQSIIWTRGGLVCWRAYAPLGVDELMHIACVDNMCNHKSI